MKRKLTVFLSLVVFSLAQPAESSFAQGDNNAVVYSRNPEANALFLKAREYAGKSNPSAGGSLANAREAIKLYERAVKNDSKFALAFIELSRAWLSLGYSEPDGLTNKEVLPHAKAAALKAVGKST